MYAGRSIEEGVASRQKQPQSAAKARKQLYINKAAKIINKMNLAALYLKNVLAVDSRLPTPDSRLPTPDSRLPTPDSRLFPGQFHILYINPQQNMPYQIMAESYKKGGQKSGFAKIKSLHQVHQEACS